MHWLEKESREAFLPLPSHLSTSSTGGGESCEKAQWWPLPNGFQEAWIDPWGERSPPGWGAASSTFWPREGGVTACKCSPQHSVGQWEKACGGGRGLSFPRTAGPVTEA